MIFLIPLTIGIGLHIFERLGEGPFALVLCVPLAFVLLRPFSAPAVAWHLAVLSRLRLPSIGRAS